MRRDDIYLTYPFLKYELSKSQGSKFISNTDSIPVTAFIHSSHLALNSKYLHLTIPSKHHHVPSQTRPPNPILNPPHPAITSPLSFPSFHPPLHVLPSLRRPLQSPWRRTRHRARNQRSGYWGRDSRTFLPPFSLTLTFLTKRI